MTENQEKHNQYKKYNNYLTLNIVAVVLGTATYWAVIPLILGIIALIFSFQVNSKVRDNDAYGAESASRVAKILGIISIVISILFFLLIGGIYFFVILLPYL